ncbi:MAG: ATP-dependent Clp protease proteolytic subunit [Planctomycetota bacterium]|nr:MAG: ATP-dependent Clp protease proteolytic subunit [Planctomycetota bacterium]
MIWLDDEEKEDKEKGKENNGGIGKDLLEKRLIMLFGPIDKELAQKVIAQLVYLDIQNNDPILMLINSPGGDADAGFAILDIIRSIKSKVITVANGIAASAATVVLLASDKDLRFATKNARLLIHQPSTGTQGTASDIEIQANAIRELRKTGSQLIADQTGKSFEQVEKDIHRDFWLNAEEAKEYGLISNTIDSIKEIFDY